MSKILLALISVCIILGLFLIFVGERWTTPANELKTTLGYYHKLARMEEYHLQRYGKYGDLQELLRTSLAGRESSVAGTCEGGYCFNVSAKDEGYSIWIFPDASDTRPKRLRALSLYADQTRIVRASYGLPRAGRASPALSDDELSRFKP